MRCQSGDNAAAAAVVIVTTAIVAAIAVALIDIAIYPRPSRWPLSSRVAGRRRRICR